MQDFDNLLRKYDAAKSLGAPFAPLLDTLLQVRVCFNSSETRQAR